MRRSLKSFAGVAVAAAALFLTALPSDAASNNFEIDSGHLVTNIGNFPLGSSGVAPPCPTPTGILTVDVDSTNSTSEVTAVSSSSSFEFAGSNWFIVLSRTGTVAENSGTITGGGSAGSMVLQNVKLIARIYAESPAGSCTRAVTPACTAQVTFANVPGSIVSGGFTAGVAAVGTQISLSGAANSVAKGPCVSPFSALTSVSVSPLVLKAV